MLYTVSVYAMAEDSVQRFKHFILRRQIIFSGRPFRTHAFRMKIPENNIERESVPPLEIFPFMPFLDGGCQGIERNGCRMTGAPHSRNEGFCVSKSQIRNRFREIPDQGLPGRKLHFLHIGNIASSLRQKSLFNQI